MTLDRPQNRDATRPEQRVARIDDDYFDIVKNLGAQIVNPGGLVNFQKKDSSGVFVPAGTYGGAKLSGTKQMLSCAPGVEFTKQVIVTGSVMIRNAFFVCNQNTPAIVVKSGGSILLIDCVVSKGDGQQVAATDRYITIEAGGYGTFSSCGFFGNQATVGTIITNEDAANPNRVAVRACMNHTAIVAATRYTNVGSVQDVAIP